VALRCDPPKRECNTPQGKANDQNRMTNAGLIHPSARFQSLLVVLVPLLCLVPFVTKAFHTDDTLFLWAAKNIQNHPGDFYGFTANWYGQVRPMFDINMNPPLVSYYIAAVASLTGWSELTLHLAFLIPALAASLGAYYLARLLCPRPHLAALVAVLTPAFLVSSNNIMSDIAMLAFYTWAAALWLHGFRVHSPWRLLASAILITLCCLTKYFGLTLVPLLFVYSLVANKRAGRWLFFLLIPVAILAGYQWLTYTLYGRGILWGAASYAITVGHRHGSQWLTKALTGLAFTGGSLAAVAFWAPFLWTRRVWAGGGTLLAVVVIAILLGMGRVGAAELRDAQGVRWGLLLQLSVLVVAGVHILGLAAVDFWNRRNSESLLLVLLIWETFAFAAFVNWTINARIILPMAPAAGVLVMRRYGAQANSSRPSLPWRAALPLLPAAGLALSISWADYSLANCQRLAAHALHTETAGYPMNLWFEGHWGFQYYMESGGAKAVDFKASLLQPGDLLIIPSNNTNLVMPHGPTLHFIKGEQLTACRWLATMDRSLGAGFYSNVWGPVPFAFGITHPEEFQVSLVGGLNNADVVVRRFRESLLARSTYADAFDVLKEALEARRKTMDAIAVTNQALAHDPGDSKLYVKLGYLYASAGEPASAAEKYRQALALNPNSAEIHCNLGLALEQQELFTEALFHYSEALRIKPDYAEAHNNLARLFFRLGRFNDAIIHYERVAELKPEAAEVQNNLGVALASAGRFKESVVHLSQALRLRPDYPEASENLKRVLSQAGNVHPLPDSPAQ
jgi:tetratricopeptide (TPR) repeat protein